MEPVGTTDVPSRKRFLTNLNRNQAAATPSPESSSSSDSSPDRLAKKTRELPNLSDCHGCGLRINYSNPKERLQPLDSMWRIVLLCRKCSKRLNSSDLCPYCFSATAGSDCFKCRDCERCIHRDCVGKYGGIAPWSYCCSGLVFLVCVDCWVPNSLACSIRVYRRKSRKRKKVKVLPELLPKPDYRVLGGGSNGMKTPEEVVKEANCVMERKLVDSVRAKETALRKAVIAKSAVELANGALNLVASKEDKGKSVSGKDDVVSKAVNDAELAFMLHRAMNSSPRISRSKCMVDSSGLAVPATLYARGSASTSACSKLEVYDTNSNLRENIDRTVSETSFCFKTSDCGSFVELRDGAAFSANISSEDNECQVLAEGRCIAEANQYLLKYRRTGKDVSKPSALCKFSDSGTCADLVSSNVSALTDTRACLNSNEWQGNGEGRFDEKHGLYAFKYTRTCRNGNYYPGNGEGNVSERHDNCMLKYTRNVNGCQRNGEWSCNEFPDRYLMKYTRIRLKGNECQGNEEGRCTVKSDLYSLKYTRSCPNGTEYIRNGEGYKKKPDRYLLKYSRTCLNGSQCQGNEKPDRFSLKYEKRSISSRPVSSC